MTRCHVIDRNTLQYNQAGEAMLNTASSSGDSMPRLRSSAMRLKNRGAPPPRARQATDQRPTRCCLASAVGADFLQLGQRIFCDALHILGAEAEVVLRHLAADEPFRIIRLAEEGSYDMLGHLRHGYQGADCRR